jgi:tetratricopeptide (TPR) repeat protein
MKRGTIVAAVALGLLLLAAAGAGAQSLLDNPDYKKAQDLERKSQEAYAAGEYDQAYEYAKEAKVYIEKSNAYVAERVLAFRANSWLKRATARVDYFRAVGVDPRFAAVFQQASEDLASARRSFQERKYEESIGYSQKVVSALENVAPATRK